MPAHKIVVEDLEQICAARLPWEVLRGSRVLVSGANGFLARYMVATLLHLNDHRPGFDCTVIGLVRNLEKARKCLADYEGRKDLRLVAQDVAQPLGFREPVDYVIHAASQASPKYFGTDPVGTLSANTTGTAQLLALSREQGVKSFLFFSSAEVYGELPPEKWPVREAESGFLDPTAVRSCYAESKRMGENMCVCWHHQHGVPAKIVRPFHTYGPGMALDDGRVFADFVANIVRGENIQLKSDGSARRAFCYLADATVGFFTVLLRGQAGQAHNVGNPEAECSIRELAEELVRSFPEKGLKVLEQAGAVGGGYLRSRVSRSTPDITKMRWLRWMPTTPVGEGFRRTVASFEAFPR